MCSEAGFSILYSLKNEQNNPLQTVRFRLILSHETQYLIFLYSSKNE